MDFEEEFKTGHLFLENRKCRVCGIEKGLLADFYKCRKEPTLRSSYSYECKACAKKRVLSNYYNKSLGTCSICKSDNVKLVGDICKNCNKLTRYNIDTLENAVLYLKEIKSVDEKYL